MAAKKTKGKKGNAPKAKKASAPSGGGNQEDKSTGGDGGTSAGGDAGGDRGGDGNDSNRDDEEKRRKKEEEEKEAKAKEEEEKKEKERQEAEEKAKAEAQKAAEAEAEAETAPHPSSYSWGILNSLAGKGKKSTMSAFGPWSSLDERVHGSTVSGRDKAETKPTDDPDESKWSLVSTSPGPEEKRSRTRTPEEPKVRSTKMISNGDDGEFLHPDALETDSVVDGETQGFVNATPGDFDDPLDITGDDRVTGAAKFLPDEVIDEDSHSTTGPEMSGFGAPVTDQLAMPVPSLSSDRPPETAAEKADRVREEKRQEIERMVAAARAKKQEQADKTDKKTKSSKAESTTSSAREEAKKAKAEALARAERIKERERERDQERERLKEAERERSKAKAVAQQKQPDAAASSASAGVKSKTTTQKAASPTDGVPKPTPSTTSAKAPAASSLAEALRSKAKASSKAANGAADREADDNLWTDLDLGDKPTKEDRNRDGAGTKTGKWMMKLMGLMMFIFFSLAWIQRLTGTWHVFLAEPTFLSC